MTLEQTIRYIQASYFLERGDVRPNGVNAALRYIRTGKLTRDPLSQTYPFQPVHADMVKFDVFSKHLGGWAEEVKSVVKQVALDLGHDLSYYMSAKKNAQIQMNLVAANWSNQTKMREHAEKGAYYQAIYNELANINF